MKLKYYVSNQYILSLIEATKVGCQSKYFVFDTLAF